MVELVERKCHYTHCVDVTYRFMGMMMLQDGYFIFLAFVSPVADYCD